jgi:hypothetical protein
MTTRPSAARTAHTLRRCNLLQPHAAAIAREVPEPAAFVIRALDLIRVGAVPKDLPQPLGAEWINRGTGQPLRPTTIAMLLRTLPRRDELSPSALRLHEEAGLRLAFPSTEARHRFARGWLELIDRR